MKRYVNGLFRLTLIAIIFCSASAFSQIRSHTFSELDSLQKENKKNIVVFIHTDWCKFCQSMLHTTFKDDKVESLLNENFLFALLNAESIQEIQFRGQIFKFRPTGNNTGIHELAEQLAGKNGAVVYPALCILNAENEIIFLANEFLSASNLLLVLNSLIKK
jgi:thioredoxin-related protein